LSKASIAVIGLGKAGLPLAAIIADSGIDVTGVDIDSGRCESINRGINPIIEEPVLDELIKKYGGQKLFATTNYDDAKDCNFFIVIVPLFLDDDNDPELSSLENAFKNVSRLLKKDDIVVLETTVPPETTETLVRGWLEDGSRLKLGELWLEDGLKMEAD
jgi:UDP-N-acetyl-D-mannosaminuronic acid dehydrogenase